MPEKRDVTIEPSAEGVMLTVYLEKRQRIRMNIPLAEAIHLFSAWWAALGSHYPAGDKPGVPPHAMVEIEDYMTTVVAIVDSPKPRVKLFMRPKGGAGIDFILDAAGARDLAKELLDGAEALDQYQRGKN